MLLRLAGARGAALAAQPPRPSVKQPLLPRYVCVAPSPHTPPARAAGNSPRFALELYWLVVSQAAPPLAPRCKSCACAWASAWAWAWLLFTSMRVCMCSTHTHMRAHVWVCMPTCKCVHALDSLASSTSRRCRRLCRRRTRRSCRASRAPARRPPFRAAAPPAPPAPPACRPPPPPLTAPARRQHSYKLQVASYKLQATSYKIRHQLGGNSFDSL